MVDSDYIRNSGRRVDTGESMIENIPEIAAGTAALGLAIAVLLYTQIEKIKIDNPTVADITQQIRDGAMAFLFAEYRYLAVFIAIVAGLLFVNPDRAIRPCSPS